MKELLFLDKLVTPKIINIIYWLLLGCTVLSTFRALFSHYGGGFFAAVFILITGAIAARVVCEVLIVLFKINENLNKIAEKS